MKFPHIAFATPRRLPKPADLVGRVAVLDIAFAAGKGRQSFTQVTRRFIEGLGDRLAVWIDHHDHIMHKKYADDDRFVLRSKDEHHACPEMVTRERIEKAGPVDTICCHTDFDGLCSAAKWIRRGIEPYPGADLDARMIDTRLGQPSERATTIDRSLRARPNDEMLRGLILRFLANGCDDVDSYRVLKKNAEQLAPREAQARELAKGFVVKNSVAVVRFGRVENPYDKTTLLLIGQQLAPISVVCDQTTVTVATRFDSGINLLKILDLQGGMPTVVSLAAKDFETVVNTLGWNQTSSPAL
ncbi:MAG: hypothetical protein JXA30_16120 [Deltaproteobacteria bacterium]|nr:hypothetical protein [Deltaproteobacteria bacterium]